MEKYPRTSVGFELKKKSYKIQTVQIKLNGNI